MNKKILVTILLGVLILPSVGYAIPSVNDYGRDYAWSLENLIDYILNALWMVFTALAVIMIVLAGILFLTAQGAPDKLQQARSAFLWGVVGVAVAIIAYSIVGIVDTMFGAAVSNTYLLPISEIFNV